MFALTLDRLGHPFDSGEALHVRFGALDVRVSRQEGEWHVAHAYSREEDEDETSDQADQPGTPKSARWVAGEGDSTARLLPAMPDRPVVVRPEFPVNLPGGMAMTLFVGVPLWLAIEAEGARLIDLPSVRLSNTWFGTPVEGALCYAMRTRALRRPEALSRRLHRAICTVEIQNTATAPLTFSRLCLPTEQLTLFKGRDRLWTNAIRMHHRGEDEWGRLVHAESPPDQAGPTDLLTPPRAPLARGLFMRQFARN